MSETATTTATCTIVVGTGGERCSKTSVVTFTSSSGSTFAECAEHASTRVEAKVEAVEVTAKSLGIKTRTTRAFVLVKEGKVVGYAETKSAAVLKRAAKAGAEVIATGL
ncbi:MAG: hypothetical protein GWP91_06520 [Rhodobacterales bacterium]|nr:hypothetical protein [Rhodobacterales bacterium]